MGPDRGWPAQDPDTRLPSQIGPSPPGHPNLPAVPTMPTDPNKFVRFEKSTSSHPDPDVCTEKPAKSLEQLLNAVAPSRCLVQEGSRKNAIRNGLASFEIISGLCGRPGVKILFELLEMKQEPKFRPSKLTCSVASGNANLECNLLQA